MESEIVYAYSVQMLSVRKIAKKFDVSDSYVDKVLQRNGVAKRSQSESHKLPVDSHFFSEINTEEKAYWLGFMYADGYITKCGNRTTMGVSLHDSDSEHLEAFKKPLRSEHKIGHYVNKNGYVGEKGTPYCSLTIVDSQLVSDLERHGVFFNKSKILQFPTKDIVPNELMNHFVRGYFDGDGSVYGSIKAPCASFDGTELFMGKLLETLRDILGTNAHIYKDHSIYCIKLGGRNIITRLFEYMYKDATVFLGRKKKRFEEILH